MPTTGKAVGGYGVLIGCEFRVLEFRVFSSLETQNTKLETIPRMKAMILAAGFGTRLWPLTIERTKPAIPFSNRPLIAYTIDYLKQYAITEIIINLHHEPESVQEQIGDGSAYGVKIQYSLEEPEILGTSGALDQVRDLLAEAVATI